jgi:hypothetical protein
MRDVLAELNADDIEHPSVSLTHESAWCLGAYQGGLLVWENLDAGEPRHMNNISREQVLSLWLKLADGRLDEIEAEPWLPGYEDAASMTDSSIWIWNRGQNDPLAISDVALYTRLSETIAWCAGVIDEADLDASMRSPDLYPGILHHGRDDVVCDVGLLRHRMLRAPATSPTNSIPNLNSGRLLCYFPDADICCGAAELESDGFFDLCNTPPWDTWIGYFSDGIDENSSYDNYLLAYVPEQLVPLAAAGIVVNTEECIMWLDDTDVKIRSRFGNA